MMSVEFQGQWPKVEQATQEANRLLSSPAFYERIRRVAHFDLTEVPPAQIADAIERCTSRISVRLYKSRWPWSKAFAYEDARFPELIFLNTRKLDRDVPSIVGTIIHEAVHAADAVSTLDFGHGDNAAAGKDNTAPYWIGNLAISMVSGQAFAVIDHAPSDVLDEQVA